MEDKEFKSMDARSVDDDDDDEDEDEEGIV